MIKLHPNAIMGIIENLMIQKSKENPGKYIEKTAKIIINSYNKFILDAYCEFIRRTFLDAKAGHVSILNQSMKIKKWTVLSSPHVHKTSRDQFERRTHTNMISIYDMTDQNVSRIAWYIQLHMPIDTRFKLFIKR